MEALLLAYLLRTKESQLELLENQSSSLEQQDLLKKEIENLKLRIEYLY